MALIAYEAGQHATAQTSDEVTELMIAANRHPRMRELYLQYFDVFFGNGGELMAIFAGVYPPSKWGSWGVKEYLEQNDAPLVRSFHRLQLGEN